MTDQAPEATAEDAATFSDDDLGAIFDQVTGQVEPEPEPEPEPTEAEKPEEAPQDEKGESEPESKTEEDKPTPVSPPNSWTAEAKEKFSDLDPAIQQEVLKREADYSKGLEKNASKAKLADEFEGTVAPYRAMMAASNVTPNEAVQQLMNTWYLLETTQPDQKRQLILDLAQRYGVELNQSSQGNNEDEYVDPDIKALRDEVSSLKNQQQSQIQQAQLTQTQALQAQIQAFQDDPKNEHFETVKAEMSALLQSGKAQTLEDAYSQALWLNETTRNTLLEKQLKDREEKRVKEETEKAKKAKKAAGVNLKSEDGGLADVTSGNLESDLGALYDKIQARA